MVARKTFPLALPESYSFTLHIRGAASPNIFEFKLTDEANQNVWRYRVEEFTFSEQWQRMRIPSSQIEFAWGPLGGGPAHQTAAIELVIAAGTGGKGTVWIDALLLQDDTYRLTPQVQASSSRIGHQPQSILDPFPATSWQSEADDEQSRRLIDFQQERDYGGLVIQWQPGLQAREFSVQISSDNRDWNTAHETSRAGSERSYIYLPQTVSRFIRLTLRNSLAGTGFGIQHIEIKPDDFSRTICARDMGHFEFQAGPTVADEDIHAVGV